MIVLSDRLKALVDEQRPASRTLTEQELKALVEKFPRKGFLDDVYAQFENGVLEVQYNTAQPEESSRWHTQLRSPISENWELADLSSHNLIYRSTLDATFATHKHHWHHYGGQIALITLQGIWNKMAARQGERLRVVYTGQTIVQLPILGILIPHLKDHELQYYYLQGEEAINKQIVEYLAQFELAQVLPLI